jgi:hypothetical protein
MNCSVTCRSVAGFEILTAVDTAPCSSLNRLYGVTSQRIKTFEQICFCEVLEFSLYEIYENGEFLKPN